MLGQTSLTRQPKSRSRAPQKRANGPGRVLKFVVKFFSSQALSGAPAPHSINLPNRP